MKYADKIVLATPASLYAAAAETGAAVAHMTYRIGRGLQLFRARGTARHRGGLMVIDTRALSGGGPIATLVSEIVLECRQRAHTGVVLDSAERTDRVQRSLVRVLAPAAREEGLTLYVQPVLADASDSAVILTQTALSGGILKEHLELAVRQYGAARVALEIERVHMDFTLPARTGMGRELTLAEFTALYNRLRPKSFFSADLCAYYFNYHDSDGTHFVLYDNADSIKRKLLIADGLGIEKAFLYFPRIRDLIPKLLPG